MTDTMELYQFYCKSLIKNGLALEELNNYTNFEKVFDENTFKKIINEKQNRKNKRYRTKNKFLEIYRVAEVVNNENKVIVFGTITLSDKYLKQKENTYIRKIHKWLKKHFIYAILNKDFGAKTEREHYHFIALTIEELESKKNKSKKGYEIFELKNKDYTMGFEPTLCIVDLGKNDINKTINYLLKLNNHSNKLGTKSRVRVIKNAQYQYLSMFHGLEPTKAEKKVKNDLKNELAKI